MSQSHWIFVACASCDGSMTAMYLHQSKKAFRGIAFVALIISATFVKGAPITVGNSLFEDTTTAPGSPATYVEPSGTNDIPDFTFSATNDGPAGFPAYVGTQPLASGSAGNTVTFSDTGSADSTAFGFLNLNDPGDTGTITYSGPSLGNVMANTDYTLTVALGNSNESDSADFGGPGNDTISLLANGTAFATTAVPQGSITNGSFQDFSVSFTTGSLDPIVGETLGIQLGSTDPSTATERDQSDFTNIRLDATAVPEPSTWALMGLGALVLAGSGKLRKIRA